MKDMHPLLRYNSKYTVHLRNLDNIIVLKTNLMEASDLSNKISNILNSLFDSNDFIIIDYMFNNTHFLSGKIENANIFKYLSQNTCIKIRKRYDLHTPEYDSIGDRILIKFKTKEQMLLAKILMG